MSPVLYQSDLATVICGDARDELPKLATESVDLVVTDPPYGVEWQSRRRAERLDVLEGDDSEGREGIQEILAETVRLVGQNRHLYVFGPAELLQGLKVSEVTELIWDKRQNGLGGSRGSWAPAHERISFAVSKHRHGGQAGGVALPARMRKGTVLAFTRANGRKVRHPTEKPVPLLAELVESSSRIGELVLDPCAGIGSTGVAAITRGRRTIAIEIHEPYARAAAERIRQAEAIAAAIAST